MKIEVREVECQHPFGEGIHVMVPPGDAIAPLLYSLDLLDIVQEDTKALYKLLGSGQAVSQTKVYTARATDPEKRIHVVLYLEIKPDNMLGMTALFMMTEPGHEKRAVEILKMIVKEFPKYLQG
jgi:hypothetical protein